MYLPQKQTSTTFTVMDEVRDSQISEFISYRTTQCRACAGNNKPCTHCSVRTGANRIQELFTTLMSYVSIHKTVRVSSLALSRARVLAFKDLQKNYLKELKKTSTASTPGPVIFHVFVKLENIVNLGVLRMTLLQQWSKICIKAILVSSNKT